MAEQTRLTQAQKWHELNRIFRLPRNGANTIYQHALVRRFRYSDGVREVADVAGAYWLLDVLATEVTQVALTAFKNHGHTQGTIELVVDEAAMGVINLRPPIDDAPALWSRVVDFTDFPPGKWTFLYGIDGRSAESAYVTMILVSEY